MRTVTQAARSSVPETTQAQKTRQRVNCERMVVALKKRFTVKFSAADLLEPYLT